MDKFYVTIDLFNIIYFPEIYHPILYSLLYKSEEYVSDTYYRTTKCNTLIYGFKNIRQLLQEYKVTNLLHYQNLKSILCMDNSIPDEEYDDLFYLQIVFHKNLGVICDRQKYNTYKVEMYFTVIPEGERRIKLGEGYPGGHNYLKFTKFIEESEKHSVYGECIKKWKLNVLQKKENNHFNKE
jgi:hypothetical protein